MEWLWLIFVVFSIISSLTEKQRKHSVPKQGKTPAPRPNLPLPEWVREFQEFFGVEEERPVAAETEKPAVGDGRNFSGSKSGGQIHARSIVSETEGGILSGFETEEEVPQQMDTVQPRPLSPEENEFELGQSEESGENEAVAFLNDILAERDTTRLREALLLAHVLPRPDFRTLPWQRKI
ncbi:MAG TPA: hypothetical protein VIL66_00500 [Bacillota bacterium]